MKKTSFIVLCGLLLLMGSWAHGQVFGTSTVLANNSQVTGEGTFFLAFDVADDLFGNSTTVNGVTFSGDAMGSSLTVDGFQSLSVDNSASTVLSPSLGNILQFGYSGDSESIEVSGLTLGRTYELQIFVASDVEGSETVADARSTGDLAYGLGDSGSSYIIDTFEAKEINHTVTVTGDDESAAIVSAVNLRELDVAAVPEPPSWPLSLVGCLFVAGWRHAGRVRGPFRRAS